MAKTGQTQGSAARRFYTSVSVADTYWNSNSQAADWVKIIGVGTTILTNEDGSTATIITDAAEPAMVLPGPFIGFTSTTALRVTMGNGGTMPEPPPAGTGASILAGSLGPCLAIAVANQATLTGLAQTIDGIALSTAGMRVYLAKQTTASQNGIWLAQSGAWTRPADWASGSSVPLGTEITIAPGGTANFQAFGQTWYTDSGLVVDTDSIIAYPSVCKGVASLASGTPSTVTVSSLWIRGTVASGITSLSLTNTTTAANGVKGVLTAGAGTGTLVITGPNTVTDAISYLADNA